MLFICSGISSVGVSWAELGDVFENKMLVSTGE